MMVTGYATNMNLDRFSQPLPYEGRDLERELEIAAERADNEEDEETAGESPATEHY